MAVSAGMLIHSGRTAQESDRVPTVAMRVRVAGVVAELELSNNEQEITHVA